MTPTEIDNIVTLMRAAGRSTVPVPISEWREMMATKIGKATVKGGKVKPVDTASVPQKIARKAKADRTEKRLRANREAKRG